MGLRALGWIPLEEVRDGQGWVWGGFLWRSSWKGSGGFLWRSSGKFRHSIHGKVSEPLPRIPGKQELFWDTTARCG